MVVTKIIRRLDWTSRPKDGDGIKRDFSTHVVTILPLQSLEASGFEILTPSSNHNSIRPPAMIIVPADFDHFELKTQSKFSSRHECKANDWDLCCQEASIVVGKLMGWYKTRNRSSIPTRTWETQPYQLSTKHLV